MRYEQESYCNLPERGVGIGMKQKGTPEALTSQVIRSAVFETFFFKKSLVISHFYEP